MTTLYYAPPECEWHDTGNGHPESKQRFQVIQQVAANYPQLIRRQPLLKPDLMQHIQRIHHPELLHSLLIEVIESYREIDADTVMCQHSMTAALAAVNAVCDAVDQVCSETQMNAFCAVRPPGHHATPTQAMGFCLLNSIAIAAEYARIHYALNRIAIVDFDVHHGNGTQKAFQNTAEILYISTHEMPNYPGTGYPSEIGIGNILNIPLYSGESGIQFQQKYQQIVLPALHNFKPQLLLLSAGFDAHMNDPLSSIELQAQDFYEVTTALINIADQYSEGRLISVLEGGYELSALAESVNAHLSALLRLI